MYSNKKLYDTIENFYKTQDYTQLEKLEKMLLSNCKEDAIKGASKTASDSTIIKRLLKSSKDSGGYNGALLKAHKFNYNGLTFEGVTDSHYVIATADTIGVELAQDNERMAFERFFDTSALDKEITIDIEELKVFSKIADKKEPYIIKWSNGVHGCYGGFNPQYLLDVLTYCKTDKIKVTAKNGYVMAPAYIEAENGERIGLVLPINIKPQTSIDSIEDRLIKQIEKLAA